MSTIVESIEHFLDIFAACIICYLWGAQCRAKIIFKPCARITDRPKELRDIAAHGEIMIRLDSRSSVKPFEDKGHRAVDQSIPKLLSFGKTATDENGQWLYRTEWDDGYIKQSELHKWPKLDLDDINSVGIVVLENGDEEVALEVSFPDKICTDSSKAFQYAKLELQAETVLSRWPYDYSLSEASTIYNPDLDYPYLPNPDSTSGQL